MVFNNKKYNIEPFESIPGYLGENNDLKATSFSALNYGDKNIHNNNFTNLVNNEETMIIKKDFKFKNSLNKINPYFYNETPGDANKCAKECEDLKLNNGKYPCSAFDYDITSSVCSLYNNIPNGFEEKSDMVSGYRNDYEYDMKYLTSSNRENVLSRIGSYYLQKKYNIKNKDSRSSLNNCVKISKGKISFKTVMYFNISSDSLSDSNKIIEIYFTYNGSKVSNSINLDGTYFSDNRIRKEITFIMNDYKASDLCLKVGNDEIKLISIDLYLFLDNYEEYLLSVDTENNVVKNETKCYKLPKIIDLNSLVINKNGSKVYIGTGKSNNTSKGFPANQQNILDNILSKNNFSIVVEYSVQKKTNSWSNIFHYGNTNNIKCPALWIWPNEQWKMRFRIKTNTFWNDGFDFLIPSSLRKLNKKLNLVFGYIEFTNSSNNQSGFVINVTCNGHFIGTYIFSNKKFLRCSANNFYIKDPWSNADNCTVYNVQFSSVDLIKMTSGKSTGLYEDANSFNNIVRNLVPPFYLIRVGYSGYAQKYIYIVYKRLTPCNNVDMHDLIHNNWFSPSRGVQNKFNEDFELYSNLKDAINSIGKWSHCTFDEPGIGFPGNCGINVESVTNNQWQSKDRGGNINWELYLFKNENHYLNLNNNGSSKIKGFNADAYCVYNNIENPKSVHIKNLNPLEGDINNDNNLISQDLNNYQNTMKNIDILNKDLLSTEVEQDVSLAYLKETKEIDETNKKPIDDIISMEDIQKKVGNSAFFESFSNSSSSSSSSSSGGCYTVICQLAIYLIFSIIIYIIIHYFIN